MVNRQRLAEFQLIVQGYCKKCLQLVYIYGINELISLIKNIFYLTEAFMEKTITGLSIHYQVMGEGKDLLLLHGWGVDSSVMRPMQEHFSAHMRVTSLDLPGFGKSDTPQVPWGIYDYGNLTEAFVAELGLVDPVILGHSFGGRIALILGARGLAKKLILVDAAGIRPKRSLNYYLRVGSYKAAKKVMALPGLRFYREKALDLWRKNNPSSDYQAAQGMMRQIFVNVVNEDLKPLLPIVTAPTLLIWGADDTATPLSDGRLMERLIPDAGLVVFEHSGHYSFLDNTPGFYAAVDYFLTHP
jgi:pimeloyl-ACP methyl ester carboxylesterase